MKTASVVKGVLFVGVAVGVAYVVYRVAKAGPAAGTIVERIKATVSGSLRAPPVDDPTWLSAQTEVAQAVDKYGLPPGVTSKESMSPDWSYDTKAGAWVLEKG